MHFRIVDLPEPDSPTRPKLWPERTEKLTSSRIFRASSPRPRLMVRLVDRDVAHGFTSASGRFQLSSRRSTASGARSPPMCGCAAIRPRV